MHIAHMCCHTAAAAYTTRLCPPYESTSVNNIRVHTYNLNSVGGAGPLTQYMLCTSAAVVFPSLVFIIFSC